MIKDFEQALSITAKSIKRSAIRELLKLTEDPSIISFAGGLPAPESFPVEELREVTNEVLDKEASKALQYGPTEGDTGLRKILAERYLAQGFKITTDNVLVTTASQQALYLLAMVFIDRDDTVIVELPSYLGGLQAFGSQGAKFVGVPDDQDGMRLDILVQKLEELKTQGVKPKLIYVVPDFQNPAGMTWSLERRHELLKIAKKYDVLIVEDSPYRELRFDGVDIPSIFSLDTDEHVIHLGTFSKIFVPGFRIGWVIAPTPVIDKMVTAKQAVDLCTPPFTQRIAARFIEKGYLDKGIANIRSLYRVKRDLMIKAFEEYMPEGVTWTKPDGGLFLFLSAPAHIDAQDLFMEAIKDKVAFVLGVVFHCDGSGKNTMRINFSYASNEQNVEGVKRLANAIRKVMAR
jgi:2-aminoadipate transaminase